MNVICFDLEGPLSPQDNAYEVMGLIPNGKRIFEALSRYDDLLALEKRAGYEPGDTLSLIAPFLAKYGVSDAAIKKVSKRAGIVPGAQDLVSYLTKNGWETYVISTSYQQHAHTIAKQVGIEKDHVYATHLPLAQFAAKMRRKDARLVGDAERMILSELADCRDDDRLLEALDDFYWRACEGAPLGEMIAAVSVVGGSRKAAAMRDIARERQVSISDVVSVGDSITDMDLLGEVKKAGGLSVAFNANRYALPHASASLACSSLVPLAVLTCAHLQGGAIEALEAAAFWEENADVVLRDPAKIPSNYLPSLVRDFLAASSEKADVVWPRIHDLRGADAKKLADVAEFHHLARSFVRGKAANLG